MKRYFSALCAALVLPLLLAACGRQEQPPAPLPADLPEEGETLPALPSGGIVSDSGRADTVEDYYARTAVIARDEWVEDPSRIGLATEVWAREYAALQYPDSAADAVFETGYAAPEGMFVDKLGGGCCLWTLELTEPSGETRNEQVQIFFFEEEGKACLTGLLAGESMLDTRQQGYDYLSLDPRFSARMQDVPVPDMPEESAAVELAALCGGDNRQDAYPLTETCAALVQAERRVVIYDFAQEKVLQEAELSDGWRTERVEDGTLIMLCWDDGGHVTKEMRISAEGAVSRPIETEELRYSVGETVITQRENSLWKGALPLLEGGGEGETGKAYRFDRALDDHRFVYHCWGYEWLEHSGIYDLAAGADHPLPDKGPNYILGADAEKETALVCRMEDLGFCYDYSLLDLKSGGMRSLGVGPASLSDGAGEYEDPEIFPAANSRGSRLCLWYSKNGNTCLEIYDLSGGLLYQWAVPEKAAMVSGVTLMGENTLYVAMHRYSTGGEWLYRIEY